MDALYFVLFTGIGVLVGVGIMSVLNKKGLTKAKLESEDIIKEANSKAETVVRQATLDGKQRVYDMRCRRRRK